MKNLTTDLVDAGPFDTRYPLEKARREWAAFRGRDGVPLLTPPSANLKLAKSAVPSYGLSLLPANASGVEVCNFRTVGCTTGCVAYSGAWGEAKNVLGGRSFKTNFLADNPHAFISVLAWELDRARLKHREIACRLNAFSDLPWEVFASDLLAERASTQFYDYTKWPLGTRTPPANYDLTTSVSEAWTAQHIEYALADHERLAVVVPAHCVDYTSWRGWLCVSGDTSDARWEDPLGSLVLLRAKGRMRAKGNPMVRDLWREDE